MDLQPAVYCEMCGEHIVTRDGDVCFQCALDAMGIDVPKLDSESELSACDMYGHAWPYHADLDGVFRCSRCGEEQY